MIIRTLIIVLGLMFWVLVLLALTSCAEHRIIFPRECEPVQHNCGAYGCDYVIHCPWRFDT